MEEQTLLRARRALRERGLQGVMLSNPATITWLTGYAPPILSGPSPFEGGSALAWLDMEKVIVLVSDTEQGSAGATGAQTIPYLSYQIDGPLNPLGLMLDAFDAMLEAAKPPKEGKIGLENLPGRFWNKLVRAWPDQTIDEIDSWADHLRAIKTDSEIEKIAAACKLCSTAQAKLRRTELAGKTEIALFDTFLTAMEEQAGERLPVLADLVAGVRTAGIGGLPTNYVVQPGDPVLADIVPRFNGYWGDICNVHFAGEPSAELKKMYHAVREALERAIAFVKPGVAASAIDQAARQAIEKQGYTPHPHHTGHGVGAAWHEEPRICAYNTMTLQKGMVIALEPGIYVEGVGGVRLEHVMVVTYEGARILTDHYMEL
jgi:Xaa-Pro dipeptidase